MPIADTLDRWLSLLKWPAAVVSILLVPGSVMALGRLMVSIAWPPWPIVPFALGAVVYLILGRLLLRWLPLPSFFATLEHEATHALFAWATFHRVVGFRATLRKGGQVMIQGHGNWLVTVAPYFFPLACFLLGILLLFLPSNWRETASALMGAALASRFASSRQQIHGQQSDLEKVGKLFAWLFLPAANLVALGVVIAYSYGGISQAGSFTVDIARQTVVLVNLLFARSP